MVRSILLVLAGLGILGWLGGMVADGSLVAGSDRAGEGPLIVMEPEIRWEPARPGEGTLFRLQVAASDHTPLMGVHGNAAGEELHFREVGDGLYETVAAVPVGVGGVVRAEVRAVYRSGGEGHLTADIPVSPGDYVHEALTVAPRFGSPLSAEDQARLERDRMVAASASARAHRTPRLWTRDVALPRESRVTSGFGDGRIFNGQVSSRHMGLDLQGSTGDTVVAAARGVVEVVEPFLLAGNVVYVNHGAGIVSGYFHLSRPLVEVGDTVTPGTPVGLVGATGRVTGPHLHWVVRYGGVSVDPRSLLDVLGGSPP